MFYLLSLAIAVVGLILLAVVIVRVVTVSRRFQRTMELSVAAIRARTGLLQARSAALRIALAQRRNKSAT